MNSEDSSSFPTSPPIPPVSLSVFYSEMGKFEGPEEEFLLVKNFPYEKYDVYKTDQSAQFYVDRIKDHIKDFLRNGKIWEPHLQLLIQKYTLPGSIAIDIGAHIGINTLRMSRCVGLKGKIYAFEPQKKLFTELIMNIKLNQCYNITAYRCAVGNHSGIVEMEKSLEGNEGGTGFGCGGDYAFIHPLDYFQFENVSLIKIDVENTERSVLLGAKETIARNRPIMLIEIMGTPHNAPGDRFIETVETLNLLSKEMNYAFFYLSFRDYLAIPKEKRLGQA